MAEFKRTEKPVPTPAPHVHSWPEHLHKMDEPCTRLCPEAKCACGAKLVVVEPGPVMVNCYWGVVGMAGHRGHVCRNQIVKGSEPPYCADHLDRLKVETALDKLVGTVITKVELDSWQCLVIHWEDRDGKVGGKVSFDADYDEDYGFEWRTT